MTGAKGNGLAKFLVQVQGFDQGEIEHGMATVAASQGACNAVRVKAAHLLKQLVGLGAQEFIARKDGIQGCKHGRHQSENESRRPIRWLGGIQGKVQGYKFRATLGPYKRKDAKKLKLIFFYGDGARFTDFHA
jgi:hypothetical protein